MMREIFTRNIGLKLIALALGISLELYFMSPGNMSSQSLRVPIELLDIPQNMILMAPAIRQDGLRAEVKIRGPAPLIESAMRSPRRFMLRIPQEIGNQRTFSLELPLEQLDLASGIEIIEVSPRVIDFRLEPTLRKEVPIEPFTEGVVGEGFELIGTSVDPSTVAIWGPESEIVTITEVTTEPINIEGLQGLKTAEVPLVDIGPHSHLEFATAKVELRAIPKLTERNFDGIKIQLRSPMGRAATLEPSKARVVISAPEVNIKRMLDREIILFASLDGIGEGTHEIAIQAELPNGARLTKVTPEKVRVTVVEKKPNGR